MADVSDREDKSDHERLQEETQPPIDEANHMNDNPEQLTTSSTTNKYPSRRIVSKYGAHPCHVCKTNASKYKFRCCRFGYCSTTCFTAHDVAACQSERVAPVEVESFPVEKRPRYVNPLEGIGIPEEDTVSDELLEKLKTNQTIRSYLEHSKLRKIITRIDNARDRISALERQMQVDPSFAKFIDDLAIAINFKK